MELIVLSDNFCIKNKNDNLSIRKKLNIRQDNNLNSSNINKKFHMDQISMN